jgi:hypothetical protein
MGVVFGKGAWVWGMGVVFGKGHVWGMGVVFGKGHGCRRGMGVVFGKAPLGGGPGEGLVSGRAWCRRAWCRGGPGVEGLVSYLEMSHSETTERRLDMQPMD